MRGSIYEVRPGTRQVDVKDLPDTIHSAWKRFQALHTLSVGVKAELDRLTKRKKVESEKLLSYMKKYDIDRIKTGNGFASKAEVVSAPSFNQVIDYVKKFKVVSAGVITKLIGAYGFVKGDKSPSYSFVIYKKK